MMGTAALVTAAGMIERQFRQSVLVQKIKIIFHGGLHGTVNPDSVCIQFPECTGSYAAYDDRVNPAAAQRHDGIAGPMLMVYIAVVDGCSTFLFRIHDDKGRRRTEMIIDHAVHTVICLNWKTYFYKLPPLFRLLDSILRALPFIIAPVNL
jgi:hypothetical protein